MVQEKRNGVFYDPREAVATQRRGKHISAATMPDATVEELCFLLLRAEKLQPRKLGQPNQFCTGI
jgi:hypothetical protein